MEELFLFRIVNVQVPPNSLQREEVNNNDLGRRSPWLGRRQEGTSDHHQCWSQFLVGFIHPVRWHPPDDGRRSTEVSLPFSTSMEKGSSQQVELKDEGGAVGGGADRQFERSSVNFSSQRPK